MIVHCDMEDCRYFKSSECQKNEIDLVELGCNDYIQLTDEELHPDIYYKRLKAERDIKAHPDDWVKTRGKKIQFLGREMFERYGRITDGRTGALICNVEDMEEVNNQKDELMKKITKSESENGISPLYK